MGDKKAMEEAKFDSYSSVKESMEDPKLHLAPFTPPKRSIWSPKTWTRRAWLWLGSGLVLIVIVVVGAVVGVKATKKSDHSIGTGPYPNYAKLNYALVDTYSPSSFLSQFNYYDGEDPAAGFVQYSSEEEASQRNLTYVSSSANSVIIRADNSPDATNGRHSIRLHSKKQYGPGLFIFDVKHTPYGCGSQPAISLADPSNWPENGEIGIMRGFSGDNWNWMNIFTARGCSMDQVKRKMLGSLSYYGDCSVARTDSVNGCMAQAVIEKDPGFYYTIGKLYNQQGGGIVAMEYRSEGIRIWQFARGQIPQDISLYGQEQKTPDPKTWGPPLADYPSTKCDMASHFRNQSIIVNIDFCGHGPYSNWGEGLLCAMQNPQHSTCQSYVAANASAFDNTYWEFGGFQIYQAV
ncbi:glycoside hydrolase family 16 protein [Cladorrhinum sp. PSN332]|nr:glycoside hydrolase family 16 protein [Cladorrhinum sp. PSN332]